MKISELVEKFEGDLENYKSASYNETLLRSDFLDPLFRILGWDINNSKARPTYEREVLLEEGLKETARSTTKKPDYTFRLFSDRKFFLEAKKPSVNIQENDDTAKQVRRYGFTANLKISVLSNFEYLIIYDCSIPVEEGDNCSKGRVKIFHYKEYEKCLDELKNLLGRDSVYSGHFEDEWAEIEKRLKKENVNDFFLAQFNSWRIDLGNEIFRLAPTIPTQQLNDVVQSYLNRIIFLRVCEDRNLEEYQSLLSLASEEDFKALLGKFKSADRKYNSGLFDQLLSDKIIEKISSVFWRIIRQLYYPESPFSFSVFASDILGSIYEIFLTEKLIYSTEKGTLVLEPKPENIDRDIVTTPTYIIKDILNKTVLEYISDFDSEQVLSLRIADIACGSGAFLIELFQLLNDYLVDYYFIHSKDKLIQVAESSFRLKFEEKRNLLVNCVWGVDKDFNAVEATIFGLLLKLLEGENQSTIPGKIPLLPDLSENISFGNSLITSSYAEEFDEAIKGQVNPYDFEDDHFDIIIGNPPYMKSEDMKNLTPFEYPIYKSRYQSSHKQFDKYYLFIERSLQLVKDGGFLGYIIPSKFTKVGAGQKLRSQLHEEKVVSKIISFGANQIFNNKSTYTCLLICKKEESPNFQYLEVKSLTDWKVRNIRETEYEEVNFSSLDDECWILVPRYLKPAHTLLLSQSVPLKSIVGSRNIFNGIQTSANSIYIINPQNEDEEFYYFVKGSKEFKIEKELTRPYFETSSGQDNLNTYRPFSPNRRVIYPYLQTTNGLEFVDIDEMKTNYPQLFSYLSLHKDRLEKRDIKPEPETENEWYRFGRHQGLENCEVPSKIVVGVLSAGNKYAIDSYQTLLSSGGTAGYCVIAPGEYCEYSIYYLQAILSSKYLEWQASLRGEVFRGGYIARGTKVLKNLPIRQINFDNPLDKDKHDQIVRIQRSLIQIQGGIDESVGNKREQIKLRRRFETLKTQLDSELKELYSLGDNDDLIPSIKDLYAAD